jgi:phosphatidylinositol alpha-1,6-mannosyltransferase
MKQLLTLDFPPEKGGIQRYLHGIVAHAYGPGDCVAIGTDRSTSAIAPRLPCPVTRFANPLSRLNKKWAIINLFFFLAVRTSPRWPSVEIECGNLYAALAPWLLSFFRKVRYRVYTYGGELLSLRHASIKTTVLKSVLRRSSALYVLGNYTHGLLRDAGIEKETIVEPPRIVLPAGSDGEYRLPRAAFSAAAPLRLLSVGRLVPHKGHRVLLEACSRLPPLLPWRLTLCGSGPLEKNLASLVREKRLVERVVLQTGIDNDRLAEEYRNADLFVHPSFETAQGSEGFGIVLLDAMAHGVPIIAGRSGGIPEVLDGGACGVLVEPGDADALAAAIVRLAGDCGERKKLSAGAYDRLRERYVWK